MTSADFMRFIIIISLGIIAFVTFLVAGTILGLMWLDNWSCECATLEYPVGMWVLGLLGLLILVSIGYEASDAPIGWRQWIADHKETLFVIFIAVVMALIVINWWQ